jgi:hypothetical protein
VAFLSEEEEDRTAGMGPPQPSRGQRIANKLVKLNSRQLEKTERALDDMLSGDQANTQQDSTMKTKDTRTRNSLQRTG